MNFRQFCFVILIIFASACVPTQVSRGLATPTVFVQVDEVPVKPTSTLVAAPTPSVALPAALGNRLRVVYAKNGTIWLWDSASAPRQLTASRADPATKIEERDRSPKISDDGLVVAFIRDGDLWAMNVDGGHQHLLASTADLAALSRSGFDGIASSIFKN